MSPNTVIRQPAVAGSFYPADPELLSQQVLDCLHTNQKQKKEPNTTPNRPPKALIVPHAGYIYSGPIAGSAYTLLEKYANDIQRVVLLGPSHHIPFDGAATSSADAYATPLGDIPLDRNCIKNLEQLSGVSRLDDAHQHEHSLEVQLPFLQQVLGPFSLVPLVVGRCDAKEIEGIFDLVSKMEHTLIIISSDLSHYHDYSEAQAIDSRTSQAILQFQSTLNGNQACGCNPLNGLLFWAEKYDWSIELLDLKNSGDTAGPKDRVVGYGAYALYGK